MANAVLLAASFLAAAGPAAGALYFRNGSRALRLSSWLGIVAVVLGTFAAVARHVAPINSDLGWFSFGLAALVALGSASGANAVALAVLFLAMAGVVPHRRTRARVVVLWLVLGTPVVLLLFAFGAHGLLPLGPLPILLLALANFVDPGRLGEHANGG